MRHEREVAGLRCGQVLEALSAYLDGDLDAAARAAVEGHVQGCHVCATFGGRVTEMVSAVRRHAAPEAMDPAVGRRLRLAIGLPED